VEDHPCGTKSLARETAPGVVDGRRRPGPQQGGAGDCWRRCGGGYRDGAVYDSYGVVFVPNPYEALGTRVPGTLHLAQRRCDIEPGSRITPELGYDAPNGWRIAPAPWRTTSQRIYITATPCAVIREPSCITGERSRVTQTAS
jgi:hypothetical protein